MGYVNSRRVAALALAAGLLASFADRAFADVPPNAPLDQTPRGRLGGSFVYIYSFLDVRLKEFGPRMLAQIDQQLAAGFATRDVRTKLLRFRDSEPGRDPSATGEMGEAGVMIPVRETVRSNADDERSVGANYRLIEFPLFAGWAEWGEEYRTRWDLYEVGDSKLIWSRIYQNTHLIMFRADENAENRAKAMVDKVIEDLVVDGYLN